MKTVVEIAEELGINPKTLSFRLWKKDIGHTSYKVIDGTSKKFYNAKAIRQIKKHLKEEPIQKVGRPRIRKGTK